MSGTVDAHVHLWDTGRFALPWFRPALGLPAVADPNDLAAATELAESPAGPVDAVIAVQAADSADEVAWLTGLTHPLLAGAVLQFDPADEGGAPAAVAAGTAVGVRAAVPDRRADLADLPALDALCERVAAVDGVLEFLVRAEQLPAVAALAARHPRTRIVLCHLGLGAGEPDAEWAEGLRALAAHENAAAKASGIVRAADAGDASGRDAHGEPRLGRALAVAVDAFGAHRLLFGSDWPMSARVAPYREIVARTAAALPVLGAAGDAAFWGGTARELYRL